jgi:hypothetical protein
VIVGDDDPLRLMYTSGTESRPKGVQLSSRSIIAQYVSCIVDGGMSADDVEVHSLPLYHCAQLDCFLGPDVYLGATSIILPGPDPDLLLRTIEAERATKLFAPPTVWISLLRSETFDRTDLSSLRKGLLRRLADAGRGAPRDAGAAAGRQALELLRSDGDGTARDDPSARGPGESRRLRRPPGAERRDPAGRRR